MQRMKAGGGPGSARALPGGEERSMVQSGRVVSVSGNEMKVCFERPEACAHCSACGEIHESLVTLQGSAPVGSRIEVDMPEKQVLKASFLAYVIPLLLLIAGIAAGNALFGDEIGAALTGILCMGLSWFLLRLIERRMRKNDAWHPRIIAIHEEDGGDLPRA